MQLAAPTYIDYVMTWVQNLLDDEATFPTKSGTFPCWLRRHRTMNTMLQAMTSHPLSLPQSSMSTGSCSASLRTFTMSTIRKYSIYVPSRTSTRCSRISLRSAASTSFWISRMSEEHRARLLLVLVPFGNAGRKWAFLRAEEDGGRSRSSWFRYTYLH